MAVGKDTRPLKTESGVFIRHDPGLRAALCFVPATGLVYAAPAADLAALAAKLNGGAAPWLHEIYKRTLGVGWACTTDDAEYLVPQLLPSREHWPSIFSPARPILVNWFITGRCPLACRYCYAEDLMRRDELEPDLAAVDRIAKTILEVQPLVVVLTGGDPLFTSNLAPAIETLSGKVALTLDTSGYTLRDDHLKLLKTHGVSVRVSIDSRVPKIHESQRPVSALYPKFRQRGRTLEAAVETLCRCLDAGIGVTVQTVATKKSANDLVALGDALYRLGVRSWRIFKVAPSAARMREYNSLVGTQTDDGRTYTGKRAKGPYEHAFSNVMKSRVASWHERMSIQVTYNETPNSVILVSPDGRFMTESNTGAGKIVIDANRPRTPRPTAIRSAIDMSGHAARYLNMTSSF